MFLVLHAIRNYDNDYYIVVAIQMTKQLLSNYMVVLTQGSLHG
jgi:hypothetical protein